MITNLLKLNELECKHQIKKVPFLSHLYVSSRIGICWVNVSPVTNLLAITVILSVFPFIVEEFGGM